MNTMEHCHGDAFQASPPVLNPVRAGLRVTQEFLVRILDRVAVWQERTAARRQLARLDDRMLRDIGIDRATADTEAAKPFWQR